MRWVKDSETSSFFSIPCNFQSLLGVHIIAANNNDANMCDFLEVKQ